MENLVLNMENLLVEPEGNETFEMRLSDMVSKNKVFICRIKIDLHFFKHFLFEIYD